MLMGSMTLGIAYYIYRMSKLIDDSNTHMFMIFYCGEFLWWMNLYFIINDFEWLLFVAVAAEQFMAGIILLFGVQKVS